MKAVKINDDKSLSWVDVADPITQDNEVKIKVEVSSINRADLLQREGSYPPPAGAPEYMGLEVSGEVVEIGKDAKNWKLGDKVCALLPSGGYAEYVTAPWDMCMPVPKNFSMEQAAAIPEVYAASYLFLFWEAKIKQNDTVLITAGASGLASALIPMAKAYGCRVLTTVHTDALYEGIKNTTQADLIINTSKEKLADVLKAELDAGRGVDVTVDCLGGDQVGECLPYMNFDGRWIMIATLANDITHVDMRKMYARRLRLIGTNLRSRTPAQKAEILQSLVKDIWPYIEEGKMAPAIYKVLPITEVEEAHDILYRGENIGKVVMKVN